MGEFDHLEWTYNGAFEQLFGLGRVEFEQKFSKNSNARGHYFGHQRPNARRARSSLGKQENLDSILDPRALFFCAWQTARRVSHVIKDKSSGIENDLDSSLIVRMRWISIRVSKRARGSNRFELCWLSCHFFIRSRKIRDVYCLSLSYSGYLLFEKK